MIKISQAFEDLLELCFHEAARGGISKLTKLQALELEQKELRPLDIFNICAAFGYIDERAILKRMQGKNKNPVQKIPDRVKENIAVKSKMSLVQAIEDHYLSRQHDTQRRVDKFLRNKGIKKFTL